jgi:hypothetical protein
MSFRVSLTDTPQREVAAKNAHEAFASAFDAIADEIVEVMEWKKE